MLFMQAMEVAIDRLNGPHGYEIADVQMSGDSFEYQVGIAKLDARRCSAAAPALQHAEELAAIGCEAIALHLKHWPAQICQWMFIRWRKQLESLRQAVEASVSPLPSPPGSDAEDNAPSASAAAASTIPRNEIELLEWCVEELCHPNPMAISNGDITVETMLNDVKVLKSTLAEHFSRCPGEAHHFKEGSCGCPSGTFGEPHYTQMIDVLRITKLDPPIKGKRNQLSRAFCGGGGRGEPRRSLSDQ